MGFITSGIFWGSVLVLIGISVIVRVIFNIDIPVFRIVVGLLFIYFGIQLLFGISFKAPRRTNRKIHDNSGRDVLNKSTEYNIVFSSGNVDLSEWKDILNDTRISVNVVFGSATIWIDPEIHLQIENNTVFGETIFPGESISFFGSKKLNLGDTRYKTLYLETNTVFGSVEMKMKG